jgi:lipoprotein NlpI
MRYQLFCTAVFAATMLLAASAEAQAPRPQDCTGKPGVDWNQQVKACTALIEAAQGSPQDRAKLYDRRASAYFALGDDDRAMADNDAAIQLDPDFAAAYSGRGDIYLDREDPDRAIAEFDQALKHDAKYVAAYVGRSAAYDQKGDFDHALADANEAIRLDPKSADAYEMRGKAYGYKGDIERALADYDEAIRVNPKRAADVNNLRGLAYMEKGDFAGAITAFSESVRTDPQAMIAYFNRGRANLFAGALPKAIEDYKRALAIAPGYPYTALWLDIAEARSKVPSTLPQAIAKLNMKEWPGPVIRMYLGQMTPAAVLAAADNPDAAKKTGQVCEANFYSGEWALRQGAKDEAAPRFRVAARECPKTLIEANAAALELKPLGAKP